ncbi:hypothetical protein GCM10023323_52750 [Streptomyces thinghirensis]|uniref:Uncharacterized protein n=1 Tax=Streptomyces thinghirensis TaxID=551547 RepID=A0ABP9TAI7_9ACTN
MVGSSREMLHAVAYQNVLRGPFPEPRFYSFAEGGGVVCA